MRFSSTSMAISLAVTLVVGFLLGFVPEHFKTSSATQGKDNMQSRLLAAQQEEIVSSFKVRTAVIYIEAAKSNFSVASSQASRFFTDLRKYTDQSSDNALRQQFEAILSDRDSIIAGLAKADPAVTQKLQALFLKMQGIQPTSTTGH